jgi:hypothetical protein
MFDGETPRPADNHGQYGKGGRGEVGEGLVGLVPGATRHRRRAAVEVCQ